MAAVSFTVTVTKRAQKSILKLDPGVASRIRSFLEGTLQGTQNPRGQGRALVGQDLWRYRVGDYRILAHIDDREITILVVEVAHRRQVYRPK